MVCCTPQWLHMAPMINFLICGLNLCVANFWIAERKNLIVAHRKRIWLASTRARVWSLALPSGLRIPGLAQWVKGLAMSCGVGCKHGSDPAWLWLWPAAIALIRPLAWEPPYAASAARKNNNNKTTTTKKRYKNHIVQKRGKKKCAHYWLPIPGCGRIRRSRRELWCPLHWELAFNPFPFDMGWLKSRECGRSDVLGFPA